MSPAHRAAVLRALDRKRAVPEKLVPVSEMARSLGLPTATVWRWVKTGRVRGVRQGARLTMVDKGEVEAFVAAHPPRKGRPKATEAVGEVEG
jgi:excisionase family DNA binding protein